MVGEAELSAVAQCLGHENEFVRLRAAEVMRERLAAGADDGVEQAREALRLAVRGPHPRMSHLLIGRSIHVSRVWVIGERIRAEAAAALLFDRPRS